MLFHYDEFKSPLGQMMFASDGESVYALEFEGYEERMDKLLRKGFDEFDFRRNSDPMNLKAQLREYYDGNIHALDLIPAKPQGTPFQVEAWKTLRMIPVGQTWSYGEMAAKMGRPQAARAVGHANSLNPVAIIVPCHRVIGASKALTGYASGLDRKRWLLDHESQNRRLSASIGG
jgi:methylated-DNA-[protein]-cysteine S-methyltransferase